MALSDNKHVMIWTHDTFLTYFRRQLQLPKAPPLDQTYSTSSCQPSSSFFFLTSDPRSLTPNSMVLHTYIARVSDGKSIPPPSSILSSFSD